MELHGKSILSCEWYDTLRARLAVLQRRCDTCAVQDELRTVRRLLKQCEDEREAEVSRRQQADERLLQVLEDNRSLASQLDQRQQSSAVQHEV